MPATWILSSQPRYIKHSMAPTLINQMVLCSQILVSNFDKRFQKKTAAQAIKPMSGPEMGLLSTCSFTEQLDGRDDAPIKSHNSRSQDIHGFIVSFNLITMIAMILRPEVSELILKSKIHVFALFDIRVFGEVNPFMLGSFLFGRYVFGKLF